MSQSTNLTSNANATHKGSDPEAHKNYMIYISLLLLLACIS